MYEGGSYEGGYKLGADDSRRVLMFFTLFTLNDL